MKSAIVVIVVTVIAVLVVACEKQAPPAQTTTAALPADLIVTSEPPGAVDVVAAKKTAQDGVPIVIRGKVAGQREPIAANRAIMTVADVSLPTCDKTPGDKCETPWDACCEPSAEVAAKSISVHVVGADGRPLQVSLGGATGIAPLKTVVVSGTAKPVAGSDAMIVQATKIYLVP